MSRRFRVFIITVMIISGCSADDPLTSINENVLYQRDGIVESFGGDCSAVQIRTSSLGIHDLGRFDYLKFNFAAMSDADLSSISIFYINEGQTVYLMNLNERDLINSTQTYTADSPEINSELFLRLTLKSSVCTGQIFHIEMRDLKVTGVN